ncbi:MAG: PAS domain-containing protein [Alphaproteobacteria bacterium]|nr:PAS domain-containing protein [Alphaproteobacteria bacterium]
MTSKPSNGVRYPAAPTATACCGESHLALAERSARFGNWRLRLADNHMTWSAGMYRLLGLDPASNKVDNDWLLNQIVDEDVDLIQHKISEAIRKRAPFYYRCRAKFPHTPAQIVDTHGEVELDADGRVASIVAVAIDVTEKLAAEVAERRAETMYRAMAEQASDIILLYDAHGHIIHATSALQRILGHSVATIDHQGYLDLVHPEDLETASSMFASPLPGELLTAAYRIRHKAGHYIWIEVTTRGIYDEQTGALRNIISVSRDVTERKAREAQTEAALDRERAANTAKSTFLANMSHELRTPLNAIIGFADVMRQQMFGPLGAQRYEEYAGLIFDSGQLLLELISDVLDMAKIEAGKMTLHFEEVDLGVVADDCQRLLVERAAERQIELTSERSQSRIPMTADRRAVKQILLNLLSNAVKFTLPGGAVSLSLRDTPERVTICVADNGVGIPAEALPRLGRPFEQVHSDPELASGGTGLGLALVRALVARHGGSFHIESDEGIGTTVIVELPRTQDGARAAAVA